MEQKKKFKTIFITLLAAAAMVGFGYGMATALKPDATEKSLPPNNQPAASTASGVRYTHGSGELQRPCGTGSQRRGQHSGG